MHNALEKKGFRSDSEAASDLISTGQKPAKPTGKEIDRIVVRVIFGAVDAGIGQGIRPVPKLTGESQKVVKGSERPR
jgi:hypothetical protein